MKLSEILAKPIKLIGGGLLNLKGFNKSIVDKEVAKEFPYDYEVVNFTVNVKAEDWTIDEGSATCNITLEVPIPLQHNTFIFGYLNDDATNDITNIGFPVPFPELDGTINVSTSPEGIIGVSIDAFYYEETYTPPENFKLEFKNLIFV